MTNSASCRKEPRLGLALGLCQTIIPFHAQPAAWIASVRAGSCRQSLKTRQDAPALASRQHSPSHSDAHMTKERWSLRSPSMGGYTFLVLVFWYFAAGLTWRADRFKPPLEYGGSVSTRSTASPGSSRRIERASPW